MDTKDTKEAIEFLERILKSKRFVWADYEFTSFKKIITLLQRGEKHKQLIEKNRKRNKVLEARIKGLKDILKKHKEMWEHVVTSRYFGTIDNRYLREVEQEHFPKPSKDFTEKVMEKINEKVKDEKKT